MAADGEARGDEIEREVFDLRRAVVGAFLRERDEAGELLGHASDGLESIMARRSKKLPADKQRRQSQQRERDLAPPRGGV